MESVQTIAFLPDAEVLKLLHENGISIDRALAEHGIRGARLSAIPAGDGTRREPVSAIIVASTVGVVALGGAIATVIRALASGPRIVTSTTVKLNPDGSYEVVSKEELAGRPAKEPPITASASILGVKVEISSGETP